MAKRKEDPEALRMAVAERRSELFGNKRGDRGHGRITAREKDRAIRKYLKRRHILEECDLRQ